MFLIMVLSCFPEFLLYLKFHQDVLCAMSDVLAIRHLPFSRNKVRAYSLKMSCPLAAITMNLNVAMEEILTLITKPLLAKKSVSALTNFSSIPIWTIHCYLNYRQAAYTNLSILKAT